MPTTPTAPDARPLERPLGRRWAAGLGCAALVVVLPALLLQVALDGLHARAQGGAPAAAPAPGRVVPAADEGGCALRLRAAPAEAYRLEPGANASWMRLKFVPGDMSFHGEAVVRLDYGPGLDPVRLTLPLGEERQVEGLPCDVYPTVYAEADQTAYLGRRVWLEEQQAGAVIELPLAALGLVRGRVLDPDGQPVAGALVEFGMGHTRARSTAGVRLTPVTPAPRAQPRWGLTRTDAAGRFELRPPVGSSSVEFVGDGVEIAVLAVSEGYLPAAARLRLHPKAPEHELTLTLPAVRGVIVRCVGFPFDSCPELSCGGPLTPGVLGGGCAGRYTALLPEGDGLDPGAALCACPDARAVVRGGGLELAVPDDSDEVVMVSPGGSIRGSVEGWPADRMG